MIRRPPRSTHCISSAASDVYKRQHFFCKISRERASHDQRASSSRIRRQHVKPAPTHGRQTSRGAGEARAKYISERAACARDGPGPRTSCCCSTCASATRLSSCSGRPPQQVKPLVVKLSMVVVLALDTRRQRESRRMLHAPRMRREPTGRRGFTLFIVSQITCERAAHDPVSYTHLTLPTICSV